MFGRLRAALERNDQLETDLKETIRQLDAVRRELSTLRETCGNQEHQIQYLDAQRGRLQIKYDEVREFRDRYKHAEERAEYWRKIAEQERDRPKTGDGHNFERLAAKLELEETPEDAVPVSGLMERINEVFGDGPPLEEILERQEAYAAKFKQEPAKDE
jgi:chromosome segregation ATPase